MDSQKSQIKSTQRQPDKTILFGQENESVLLVVEANQKSDVSSTEGTDSEEDDYTEYYRLYG